MRKVILYEPSIGSDNIGDQIIVDSIKAALKEYLENAFVVELPTHTPLSKRYLHYLGDADLKIVCGSNLIVGRLNTILHLRQWDIGKCVGSIGPLVMMGVGAQKYGQNISLYTKWAYKKMMQPNFVHSVRDGYTEELLKKIGITNVVNTGCPTMWGITQEHCATIPKAKAEECVFTLTDYKKNEVRDNRLINILRNNYNTIYFWPQGNGDWRYFNTLKGTNDVRIISPSLDAYNYFLDNNQVDYIGTRLHGGMRAMQKEHRTLIIGIDNRAIELHRDFNVPVLEESRIDELESVLNQKWDTNVILPEENIRTFLNQFLILN